VLLGAFAVGDVAQHDEPRRFAFPIDIDDAELGRHRRATRANDLDFGTFAGNGRGRETITPQSQAMFDAVRQDRLAEFVINHPDVIAKEK